MLKSSAAIAAIVSTTANRQNSSFRNVATVNLIIEDEILSIKSEVVGGMLRIELEQPTSWKFLRGTLEGSCVVREILYITCKIL